MFVAELVLTADEHRPVGYRRSTILAEKRGSADDAASDDGVGTVSALQELRVAHGCLVARSFVLFLTEISGACALQIVRSGRAT